MTARHMLMGAALAFATWLAIFGDKTPEHEFAEPVARSADSSNAPVQPAANEPERAARAERAATIAALVPREQLIGGARAAPQALFASQSWTPPPPPPPPAAPAAAPSAPPLPFEYIGKKIEDGKWEVYLARGDNTYVVREATVIEGLYQVQSITPPTLALRYLPLKEVQTITIGGID